MWVQAVWDNLLCWVFFLCFRMLILLLPLPGLGSPPAFFALGSVYVVQVSTIWIWISFLDSLFFPGFGQIELLNVASVLQEQGDAGWKACTRSPGQITAALLMCHPTLFSSEIGLKELNQPQELMKSLP